MRTNRMWCLVSLLLLAVSAIRSAPSHPQSFQAFVRATRAAAYASWQKKYPELTSDHFAEMKAYILHYYDGVTVTNTFLSAENQVVDCVVTSTQPGLRNGSNRSTAGPPPGQNQFMAAQACREGTIPLTRISLDDMARFKTVQGFLRKSDGEHVPGAK